MRISPEGNDMYICQLCARDLSHRAGNVCPDCLTKLKTSSPDIIKTQVKRVLESWEKQSMAKADFLEKLIPFLDWSATDDVSVLRSRLVSIGKLCNEYAAETTKK